ncbi:MAG TPA: MFS transporter [Micromonosporaceae bacterium]|jgi:MFS family permease
MRLGSRGFAGFIVANATSMIGDAFRVFTLILWIFETSGHSGLAVAGLMVAQMVPSVLAGSVAGALVDRWPRRRTLIACDVIRTITGLGLVAAALGHGHRHLIIGLLLVTASSTVGVVSSIAGVATIPHLVADEHLDRANGIWTVAEQLSFVIGPAVGAFSFARWGAVPALALDAATFALSALTLAATMPEILLRSDDDEVVEPLRRRVADGLRYLRADRMIRGAVVALGLRSLSAGVNNTIMVFFIAESLHHNPADLAVLAVANGIVQVAVGGVLIAIATRARMAANLRLGAYALMAGGIIVALAPNLAILIVGVIVTAIGNAPANIGQNVVEQRFVRAGFLGRVRGMQEVLIPLCFLIATSASGALVGPVGARTLLIASAVLLSTAAAVTETSVIRRLGDRMPSPEPVH